MYSAKGVAVDMEKEYHPSKNSKRFADHSDPCVKVHENFFEVCGKETQRMRAKYKVRENVRYGGDVKDNQLVDIYYEGEEKDSPVFVYIHGGYWQMLDKSNAGCFVGPLVEHGYRVVVMDYNICPQVTLQQLVDQMYGFFRWIFDYAASTKASSISLCGHSAGAHLATLLLNWNEFHDYCTSITIDAIFLIAGVYDLRELWNMASINPNNILSLDLQKATELSPICWNLKESNIEPYKQRKIAIHIVVGENESHTFIQHSRTLYEKLKAAGLNVAFKLFEKYDHFDIIEEASQEDSAICSYVLKNIS